CNVYAVREGDAALLINLGDGSVLDHLGEIGVKRVEWVLFTDHHREECQGAPRLAGSGAKVGAPEIERRLFEEPTSFRKMNVSLGDEFTIHGASYVRPPIQPIAVDRGFKTNELFEWRGHEFLCLGSRGASPGGMTYLLRRAQRGRDAHATGSGRDAHATGSGRDAHATGSGRDAHAAAFSGD